MYHHGTVNIAVKAVRRAGNIINRGFLDIERIQSNKLQHNNYVHQIVNLAEKTIFNIIRKSFPSHNILTSENNIVTNENNYKWIVNTLDGKMNFIHGLPYYCISIALHVPNKKKCTAEHAVIYDPSRNDLFTASRGTGAFLNERRIRVTKCNGINNSLIGSTNASYYINMKNSELIKILAQSYSSMRYFGSIALDLANVAASRLDGFFGQGFNLFNVSASCLIIKEAGGLVGNYKGDSNITEINNNGIIAGNPQVFSQIVTILRNNS